MGHIGHVQEKRKRRKESKLLIYGSTTLRRFFFLDVYSCPMLDDIVDAVVVQLNENETSKIMNEAGKNVLLKFIEIENSISTRYTLEAFSFLL